MKFLFDAQLPPALASWLREAGHEATHVEDAGLREDDDRLIWAHAQQTGAVIVWLLGGNTTNRVLRAWIEPRLPGVVQLLAQGSRVGEVV